MSNDPIVDCSNRVTTGVLSFSMSFCGWLSWFTIFLQLLHKHRTLPYASEQWTSVLFMHACFFAFLHMTGLVGVPCVEDSLTVGLFECQRVWQRIGRTGVSSKPTKVHSSWRLPQKYRSEWVAMGL